jgi:hypothetical protein
MKAPANRPPPVDKKKRHHLYFGTFSNIMDGPMTFVKTEKVVTKLSFEKLALEMCY